MKVQRPTQYELDALSVRGTMTVEVEDQERWADGLFDFGDDEPGSLHRVMISLRKIEAEVPPEYRDVATCEITSEHDYDRAVAHIRVTYSRPQTDEEWGARVAEVQARQQAAEAEDRALLARLQEKYA